MKANELRIGNLFFDRKYNRIVSVHGVEPSWDEVWCNHANGSGIYRLKIDEVEPITLTEEWLLRFGFKKTNSTWYKLCNFCTNISFDIEWGNNWMGIRLKYIHQLQNLYFALTGKELELK